MNAEPTDAPELAAWQDSLGRLTIGEANATGAWIAAPPEATVDVERCR